MGENLRQVADFQQGHVRMLAVLGHGLARILADRTLLIQAYPAEISGTAARAARSPMNFQRLKCSFNSTRARSTVTAG